jgi:hypothetical protein
MMQHGHAFGQDQKRPGEIRTIIVIGITGTIVRIMSEAITDTTKTIILIAAYLHVLADALSDRNEKGFSYIGH